MIRIWKYLKNSLIILSTSIWMMFAYSCAIVPIVKPIQYYSPRPYAQVVDYIPKGTIYIGTAKMVPGDYTFITAKIKQNVIDKLLREAAKAGADYVVITDIQNNNKDYFFDVTYSDGYTIEGEMFRRISE